jgi:predicted DCC family thiol-disulfide oxidoreductase YuxK
MTDTNNQKILYFDGICNLCAGAVQFVLKRNKKQNIFFASLQSKAGQEMLAHFGLPQTDFNSLVFVENGKMYQQSTGALRVARHLNAAWPLLFGLIIIPPFIRNAVYNWVAKNRYKWFGKKNECWLPTPDLKKRFLD